MKHVLRSLLPVLFCVMVFAAEPRIDPVLIEWQAPGSRESTLSVQMPDGEVRTSTFAPGEKPLLRARDLGTDGAYTWELRCGPVVRSGAFTVRNGAFLTSAAVEPSRRPIAADWITSDDVFIDGRLCAGLDCTGSESLNNRTVLLKSGSIAIDLEDTSTALGYPSGDWRIQANDPNVGGANKLTIAYSTSGSTPFTIEGGAPHNAFYVDDTGRIGIGTATPAEGLHLTAGWSPTLRLEQNTAGDNPAQTWDVGGTQYQFFIRDVTGGSALPLRIRAGAPDSAIDIQANGNVGLNCNAAASDLVIASGANCSNPSSSLNAGDAQFTVASSRTFKENLAPVVVPDVLDKLQKIDVYRYDFIDGPKGRMGLMAEDFHEIFARGSDKYIDGNEVQMALWLAVRQLAAEKRELVQRMEALEAKLAQALATSSH